MNRSVVHSLGSRPSSPSVTPAERLELAADWRHRRRLLLLLLLLPILFAVLSVVLVRWRRPVYLATGTVEFERSPYAPGRHIDKRVLSDIPIIVSTDSFLDRVAQQLPDRDLTRLAGKAGCRPGGPKHAAAFSALVREQLKDSFFTQRRNTTPILAIYASASDPVLAADIVNAVIHALQDEELYQLAERYARAAIIFERRLAAIHRDILTEQQQERQQERETPAGDRTAEDLARLDQGQGGTAPARPFTRLPKRLAGRQYPDIANPRVTRDYNPSLDEADAAALTRDAVAAERAHLAERLARTRVDLLQALAQDSSLDMQPLHDQSRIRTELAGARQHLAGLSATLGPDQPQVRAEVKEIQQIEAELNAQSAEPLADARTDLRVAELNVAGTQALVAAERQRLSALLASEIHNQGLEIDLALNRSLYTYLQARLQEYRVNAGMSGNVVEIIDPGLPPLRPERPRLLFTAGRAGLAGCLLAVLVVFGLYLHDLHLWTVPELEAVIDVPVMAVLPQLAGTPRSGRQRRHKAVVPAQHGTVETRRELEAHLLALYESLTWATPGNIPRTIPGALPQNAPPGVRPVVLVTSSLPGEGKSTTLATLAAMLARGGQRVLLLDADLHRPTLHRAFSLARGPGLSDVLSERGSLEDTVQRVPSLLGLDVLTAGPAPLNVSDLLASTAMRLLLDRASRQYDLVLVDSPPLLGSGDAIALAPSCDQVFLVARYNQVSRSLLRRSRLQLLRSGATLRGAIINGVPNGRSVPRTPEAAEPGPP